MASPILTASIANGWGEEAPIEPSAHPDIIYESATTFIYLTDNNQNANALSSLMITEIPTWAPAFAVFHRDNVILKPEVESLLIGLLVFDNTKLSTDPNIKQYWYNLSAFPKAMIGVFADQLTNKFTRDINDKETVLTGPIPIVTGRQLITGMRPGDELDVDIILERGLGLSHAKHQPCASIAFLPVDKTDPKKGMRFTVDLVGQWPLRHIVENAMSILPTLINRPPDESKLFNHSYPVLSNRN